MLDPKLFILYVKDPIASAAFYTELLGKAPVEASATFAMFSLDSGAQMGLWAAHTVEPSATAVGGAELAFPVEGRDAVKASYTDWSSKGLTIAQTPTEMDFGLTFVALDPDGHRLRVFAPSTP